MKVRSIHINQPALTVVPLGNRLYGLAHPNEITVYTDEGCFLIKLKQGFVTNFRSGGLFVDMFIDQVGDQDKSLVYLIHDALYTPCDACGGEHPLSRELADEILRAALIWAGMSPGVAGVVYRSVRLFGKSAYENDDELTATNRALFSFQWRA